MMAPATLLVAALALAAGPAEPDRSQMGVPAFSVFEGMLRFAAAGERDKIDRSLDLLAPVLAEHDRIFGTGSSAAVTAAMRTDDKGDIELAVRTLVARDVAVLLRRLAGAPRDRARTWARTAMLEWRLIEGTALARDLRAAQSISLELRDLGDAIGAGDVEEAGTLVPKAEKELLQLFRLP
jgi:hypothetical protein